MKKIYLLMISVFGLLACSDSNPEKVFFSNTKSLPATVGETNFVAASDAKAHVGHFRHSIVNSWHFADATSSEEQISVPADSTIPEDGFAIDADVAIDDDSVYTVASAGVDGDSAAWMVQVEEGKVVFSWRASAADEWQQFKSEKGLKKGELNNVRVEHAGHMMILFVNGSVKGAFITNRRFTSLQGSFTIGFDMADMGKCHCHNGHIEQIGVESVDSLEEVVELEVVDELIEQESTESQGEVNAGSTESSNEVEWIAVWNFDDASNVGLDATGKGHDAVIGEGTVSSVDGIAHFDGKSGFYVDLKEDLVVNEFVLETRVKPSRFGRMQNIIVAEPPGRGVDGWQLRVDEGSLTFHIRDDARDYDDWNIFYGKDLALNEWTEIRVERSNDSVKVFQDGELTIATAYNGDVTQMRYDWGIGYDAMNQTYHSRYFDGDMDYIRFGKFNGFSAGVMNSVRKAPLVAWEFNEPKFIGLDKMANNSTHNLIGNICIADTTVAMDGSSGLQVLLSKVFKRNEFAIEARVKPTAFATMQNIVAAEPPGRFGDGWIVRVDDGVLTVHFRDEEVDGTEWNVLVGEMLALNEWNEIRVERTADSIKVFQNGVLTVSAVSKGDVSQLAYNIGIGYDAVMQSIHDRYFNGEIDYIRFYGM